MKVEQITTIVNDITKTILGENAVAVENLDTIVDTGKSIFDATDVDNYVRVLVDKVGKVIFNDRKYTGSVPSVFMDSWEYGSIVQKITAEMPQAQDSDSWNLQDQQSYDVNVFYQPKVENKFFNSKVAFEIPMSFTEMQVKSSFNSSTELNAFLSMIVTNIENSITVKVDALIMRTINSMIAQTVKDEYGTTTPDYTVGKVKTINLLEQYNATVTTPIKVENALSDGNFLRYATYLINLYADRISKMSTLFNVGNKARFTPKSSLSVVLLSDFKSSAITQVSSNTYNEELVQLPTADTVPYWQGSGTGYTFNDVAKINVEIETDTIEFNGILGIMFDKNAVGVCNTSKRVTTNYNAKGEFYNNYYKFDSSYFNDLNENFIVFYIEDPKTT